MIAANKYITLKCQSELLLFDFLSHRKSHPAFPRPLQRIKVLRCPALVVIPKSGIGIIGVGSLCIRLDEKHLQERDSHTCTYGTHPSVIVKISRVLIAENFIDRIRDHRPDTGFNNRVHLDMFSYEDTLPFHKIHQQVIIPVGMLQVKSIRVSVPHSVDGNAVDFSFDMNELPVSHYIFQMVPTDFNSKVMLVVEKIPGRQVILRNGQSFGLPVAIHVRFVFCHRIEEHKVTLLLESEGCCTSRGCCFLYTSRGYNPS